LSFTNDFHIDNVTRHTPNYKCLNTCYTHHKTRVTLVTRHSDATSMNEISRECQAKFPIRSLRLTSTVLQNRLKHTASDAAGATAAHVSLHAAMCKTHTCVMCKQSPRRGENIIVVILRALEAGASTGNTSVRGNDRDEGVAHRRQQLSAGSGIAQ
jgi:hypothetical protein